MPKANPYIKEKTKVDTPEIETPKKKKKVTKPKTKAVVKKKKKARSKDSKRVSKDNPKNFTFIADSGVEYTITQLQKAFCEFYVNPTISGRNAVILAGYDVADKNSADSIASENLQKLEICEYLTTLIENSGLNNAVVDKHMYYNITQFDNLTAKNQAITEYNRITGRHAPEKLDVRSRNLNLDFKGWTPEELEDYIEHDKLPDRITGQES